MLNYQNENWDEPRLTHRDFRAFFESSQQAMFVEDRDGYIVSLNAAAGEFWGAQTEALIGKHASEILPPLLGTSSIGTTRRSHHLRPDGIAIEIEVLSSPLTLGNDEAFLTTVWPAAQPSAPPTLPPADDTANAQAQKMVALERLSGRVSFDLNNILTSIIGFASLIQADDALGATSKEYTDEILAAARRAENLSGELRSFGHRPEPQTDRFQAQTAIEQADSQIRRILGDQISLTTIIEEEIAPIPGSVDSLSQILLQLAHNTRKSLEGAADGQMKIELGCDDDSHATILSVSDDGSGMDEASATAAFEPIFAPDGDRNSAGFGLAGVHAATRNLSGTVVLDSTEGCGTRLTFTFPASTAPEPAREPAQKKIAPMNGPDDSRPAPEAMPSKKRTQPPGGDETILVVEDEPMVREIVVRSLTHLGYTVHKACDGQEGLELSRQLDGEIDLIFSDIVMPRLSGPEMIQMVRAEDRATPVLFTTGFTESKHLLENGGDLREGIDLLQKPYTPSVLAQRVREKLDSLIS